MLQASFVVLCNYEGKSLKVLIAEESNFEDMYRKLGLFYPFPFTITFKNDKGEVEEMKKSSDFYKAQFCMTDRFLRLCIEKKNEKKTKGKKDAERGMRERGGSNGRRDSGTYNNKSSNSSSSISPPGSNISPTGATTTESMLQGTAPHPSTSMAIVKSHYMGGIKCFAFNTTTSFNHFKAKLRERHKLLLGEVPWVVGKIPKRKNKRRTQRGRIKGAAVAITKSKGGRRYPYTLRNNTPIGY